MRQPSHARGYDARWSAFAKSFLKARPKCEICGKPSVVCGHWVMSAESMIEAHGQMVLDTKLYKALCRSCNALSKTRRGI